MGNESVSSSVLDRPEVAEIRKILQRLLDGFVPSEQVAVKASRTTLAKITASFAAEVYRSTQTTDLLFQRRFVTDAATTARRAFEHAVMAAWMVHEKDSVSAFAREKGMRAPRALLTSIKKTAIVVPPETLARVEEDLPTRTEIDEEVKRFERICGRFNPKLYVVYRLLSGSAHPSGTTPAYMFIESDQEQQAAEDAAEQTAVLALHTAAASLVWAARALDWLNAGQPDKRPLRKAARELGISPVLYPRMPDEDRWPI
jgi:hypothetical protein